jgi:hypothetical protein
MKEELKSLEEFNTERSNYYQEQDKMRNSPRPNGIACPMCLKGLVDDKPNEMTASIPPKKSVKCLNPNCNYSGYRLV